MARKRIRNPRLMNFAGFRIDNDANPPQAIFTIKNEPPVQNGTVVDPETGDEYPVWEYHREVSVPLTALIATQINATDPALEAANGGPLSFEVHVRRKDGATPPWNDADKVDIVFGKRPADGQWPSQLPDPEV